MSRHDIAVLGGGPAGYVAAIKGAMLGASVILFERQHIGGTCLNKGCVPTKSYVKTAEILGHIRDSHKRGIISDANTSIDMSKVVDYKDSVVKKLTGGVSGLLRSRGVKVVNGEARLKNETTIVCDGKTYQADKILLCGGSAAGLVPIPGADLDGVLTSDGILELRVLPKRLCVIGGGVIGCEIATAFVSFGSQVTIVELADSLVPMMDAEISAQLHASLRKLGVAISTGAKVQDITRNSTGLNVNTSNGVVSCDTVLLSVGREADLSCLGELSGKIACERGYVRVDDAMRTNIPNIFAPGDINGRSMLAHAAFKMGEIAAENAVSNTFKKCDLGLVPSCVYTIPEASSVGMTEAAAVEAFGAQGISVGRFPFAANGRALASGESEGFVKVIADAKYGEILGVHMFGAGVTELIAEAAALMNQQITVHEASEIIHSHPTLSEAFMEACADALGKCIHLPKPKPSK